MKFDKFINITKENFLSKTSMKNLAGKIVPSPF